MSEESGSRKEHEKDHKEHGKEKEHHKDHKDFKEKEHKDHKDFKEKEHKDHKDHKEKEHHGKEHEKHQHEKEHEGHGGGRSGVAGVQTVGLGQGVTPLVHFIGSELRPDLVQGTLRREPDLSGGGEATGGQGGLEAADHGDVV
jgi:hypothetical protein